LLTSAQLCIAQWGVALLVALIVQGAPAALLGSESVMTPVNS
jgi:hypothetical protein